jgi:hypothetical protein
MAGVHSDNVLLIADEASGSPRTPCSRRRSARCPGHNATMVLAGNPVRSSGLFYDDAQQAAQGVLEDAGDLVRGPSARRSGQVVRHGARTASTPMRTACACSASSRSPTMTRSSRSSMRSPRSSATCQADSTCAPFGASTLHASDRTIPVRSQSAWQHADAACGEPHGYDTMQVAGWVNNEWARNTAE